MDPGDTSPPPVPVRSIFLGDFRDSRLGDSRSEKGMALAGRGATSVGPTSPESGSGWRDFPAAEVAAGPQRGEGPRRPLPNRWTKASPPTRSGCAGSLNASAKPKVLDSPLLKSTSSRLTWCSTVTGAQGTPRVFPLVFVDPPRRYHGPPRQRLSMANV